MLQRALERVKEWLPLGVLLALATASVFIWSGALASADERLLQVSFLDVGQGDATFIETPGGRQVLIDGGRNRAVLSALSSVLPFWDRSIDVVIATHPDADHIGGLVDVLERYEVEYVIESGNTSDTAVYRALDRAIEKEGAKRITARRGQTVELGAAELDILFPDRDVSGVEPNAASIIARFSYGDTDVLLTGDAPKAIERHLVVLEGDPPAGGLQSEILKVGHHGSNTSSDEVFLGFVAPQVAIISAGRDNRYGHPHQEVLDALKRFDIETLGTYEEGTITYASDGQTFRRE